MFTVRVDHPNGDGREVYQCSRYRVAYGPLATLTLFGATGQGETVALSSEDKAFVMNESGATIDQIWATRKGA